MTISDNNLDIVILCALRYAMSRRSYVVGIMRDFIKKHWPELNEYARDNIIRDIGNYLAEDMNDSKDIYETWKQLYKELAILKTELQYNKSMNKLHFKTTAKRIKDLMLSPDFNEMKVTKFYPGIFTLLFPNDVKIVVNLAADHLGNASPYELFYTDKEGHGQTSEKMQITWKFAFAVWNKLTLNNPVLGEYDNSVKNRLDAWARLVDRGYAKCMWDNKTILSA